MFIEIEKKRCVSHAQRGVLGPWVWWVKSVIARRGEGFTSAARFAPSCPGRSGAEGVDEGKEGRRTREGGVRGFIYALQYTCRLQNAPISSGSVARIFAPKLRERGMARARAT